MKTYSKYVGMDVHKDSITIAVAEGTRGGEIRVFGKIRPSSEAVKKALVKIAGGNEIEVAYEAGPTGYGLYRQLKALGYECVVVAPSLIPQKSGDRVKTDRRDAQNLAKLLRAGELTGVEVPGEEQESLRDLSRSREDGKEMQRIARQRLLSFCLRHGQVYEGKNWSGVHMNWLKELSFPQPASQIVFQEYVHTVTETSSRVERITKQIEEYVAQSPIGRNVEAYQALRGVSLIVAAGLAAELGDVTRFDHPKKLMAFVGLVPSEESSGASVKRGGITKTGNTHVRRLLVEGAWAYRHPARVSRVIAKRLESLPKPIQDIGWKGQIRLCKRYRALAARGKAHPVVITAIAREMTAFVWEIARELKKAN